MPLLPARARFGWPDQLCRMARPSPEARKGLCPQSPSGSRPSGGYRLQRELGHLETADERAEEWPRTILLTSCSQSVHAAGSLRLHRLRGKQSAFVGASFRGSAHQALEALFRDVEGPEVEPPCPAS